MSAIEDMVGNMLKKAMPPEIMEMLAPEKVREIGERLNAFVSDLRENQTAILERLDRIDERLGNDGHHNSSPCERAGDITAA